MSLVPCCRHTAVDLAIWKDMEKADRATAVFVARSGKAQRAKDVTLSFLADGKAYCGVSWGKDSVVVAHLLWSLGADVPIVRLRPTNSISETDATRDAYFAAFPGQDYYELPVDYGTLHADLIDPLELDRKTDQRWNAAIRDCERQFGRRHILGIRGKESPGRMVRMCRWGESSINGCAPIGWWSTADVFAYLAMHDLPIHPAYAMFGGGRWSRDKLRVAEIGDTHGTGSGRREWEMEYFGDVWNRVQSKKI